MNYKLHLVHLLGLKVIEFGNLITLMNGLNHGMFPVSEMSCFQSLDVPVC